MIARIIFFIYPLLLILFPVFLYRTYKPCMVSACYWLAFSKVGLKTATILLAIVVFLFNLTYVAVFHKDFGFMISTFIMFFLLSTKKSIRVLLSVRRNKYKFIFLALLTLIILFLPNTFPISYTLAAILECACFFPAEGLEFFYHKNFDDENLDKVFVDAYFS